MSDKPPFYRMVLKISDKDSDDPIGIKILPPYDSTLDRVIDDYGTTLKEYMQDDFNELRDIWFEDHPIGVFDCLIRYEPTESQTDCGVEYDVDFDIVEEKNHE